MDRVLFISRGLAFKAAQEVALYVGPAIIDGAKWLDDHPPLELLGATVADLQQLAVECIRRQIHVARSQLSAV